VIPNTVSVIGGKIKTLVIPIGGSIVHVCNSAQLRAMQSAIPTASISLRNSHVTTTEDPIHGGSTVTAAAGTNPVSDIDVCRTV
jgi:hypothetical protein